MNYLISNSIYSRVTILFNLGRNGKVIGNKSINSNIINRAFSNFFHALQCKVRRGHLIIAVQAIKSASSSEWQFLIIVQFLMIFWFRRARSSI